MLTFVSFVSAYAIVHALVLAYVCEKAERAREWTKFADERFRARFKNINSVVRIVDNIFCLLVVDDLKYLCKIFEF